MGLIFFATFLYQGKKIGLRHTFSSENPHYQDKGSTENLMFSETRILQTCAVKSDVELIPIASGDYVPDDRVKTALKLYKYQWGLIHNPQRVWFSWLQEEGEGELLTQFKGTSVVFLDDTAIRKERLLIYSDTSKVIKVKFETSDTSKTKVAYQLVITTESSNTKLSYPKTGYDTLVFNEIKEMQLDSIPAGKYTLTCKVKVKTLKNNKEAESEKEFSTSFFIRKTQLEITTALLASIFTNNPDTGRLGKVARAINKYSEDFGLVNVNRMSHFLAQVGYESDGFKGKSGEGGCYTKTNANWSIWFSLTWKEPPFCNNCTCDITLNLPIQRGSKKLKWTSVECKKEEKDCYAVPEEFICKKPGKAQDSLFLSYVYQCEGGNGNSSTGDGYVYRGHGAIQLTWKKTYEAFNAWLEKNYPEAYKDVLSNPSIIDTDEELFVLSALWFWENNEINKTADNGNVKQVTKKINKKGLDWETRENIYYNIKNKIR